MSKSNPINPSVSSLHLAAALVALTFTAAPQARAQTTSSSGGGSAAASAPAPYSCANDPERHRFDFWLGTWDVKMENGTHVGDSIIESSSNGCAVLENWAGAKGGKGKSLNSYNPQLKQWQQFWIGSDGDVHEYRESKSDGASLVFYMKRETPTRIVRLTFTPIDPRTVRQHSELSEDGGQTWKTEYDFYYHRK
ncbi:MAG TPA: hypothetical protein VJ840_18310 [Gemmatimonadaceae bacterium]|nr:hypothetical protein [Gemmatimonadaceae bacterium]